ncbi:transcriptional regulator [Microbacterium sp. Root53]|uniref:GNAT family N-acetyltransferase n=1 Tax=Microbacterium sp. Root53 TaxID=1736553 RepID=UPI0006F821C4|nr:GNAT family N-acetyltransferase [Microbacterium sp. Root53]KQY96247.1 transcriptional regulator [Microbacterium sp. Root53]
MLTALELPAGLSARDGAFILRAAEPSDADALIALISSDPISAARGDVASAADRDAYVGALEAIQEDPRNLQLVAERDGGVIATLQLTLIPGLARRGALRLQVETVRVRDDLRSAGIGGAMMRWVSEVAAPALGARMIQLTSDAARIDAHRFYERLGYAPSHVGFKLSL